MAGGIFDSGIFDTGVFDTPSTGGGGGGPPTITVTYPANYPCPEISSYRLGIDTGLSRVKFENGHSRQRRLFDNMPTVVTLSFVVSVQDLFAWQKWVSANAYDWFGLSLVSRLSGPAGGMVPHRARFASDLQIEALSQLYMRVSVQAELEVI